MKKCRNVEMHYKLCTMWDEMLAVNVQSNKLYTMWDKNASSINEMKTILIECFESRSKEIKYNVLYIYLSYAF